MIDLHHIRAIIQRRRPLWEYGDAIRLSHHEIVRNLTVDYYAGHLLLTSYEGCDREQATAIAAAVRDVLRAEGRVVHGATEKYHPKDISGACEGRTLFGDPPPERFEIREHDLRFLVSFREGYSTGLFLDMRNGRRLAREIVKSGNVVLNLFSYTGGFSIAAARSGAARVIEVDIGGKWLGWARENQRLNNVDVVRQRREDAVRFIHKQKPETFDLIVCDPPTTSTVRSGVRFTLEKGYRAMAADFSRVLRPGGQLLACANYRAISRKDFFDLFRGSFELRREVPIGDDFAGDDYLKVGLFRKK